jgi:galactokinase
LYGSKAALAQQRYRELANELTAFYGPGDVRYFSAPGRTEIGGNHTDHQGGRVLAAAIHLGIIAAAKPNGLRVVRLRSHGFAGEFQVGLAELNPKEAERNTTAALIRGVAARMQRLGCPVSGFDACCAGELPIGSGLSSSAAFEVLLCSIIDALFGTARQSSEQRALAAMYAENVYFGKPSGLMDQMACAVGGLVSMDFSDAARPTVRKVNFRWEDCGYYVVITHTGGSHQDLTDLYAAIPREMEEVAHSLGGMVLGQVKEEDFWERLPELRRQVSDRALLRAMHFFGENRRVWEEVRALEGDDLEGFFSLVNESGRSSLAWLQNCYVSGASQPLMLALAVSEKLLGGRGAWRIHGGGFAGSIQALVPEGALPE